jgi:hypothetical protein
MRRIALAIGITFSGLALVGFAVFAVTYPCYMRAKVKVAAQRGKETAKGITSYRHEKRRCPTPEEVVAAGYVSPLALVDPWGTTITFQCSTSGNVVVRSAGRDRQFNTTDDITEGES